MKPRLKSRNGFSFRLPLCIPFLLVILKGSALCQSDSTADPAGWAQGLREFWDRPPAVSLFYGVTHTSWSELNFSIPNPGMAELRAGRIIEETEDERAQIIRSKYDFVSLLTISNTLGTRALEGDANIGLWRIALGSQTGYGYGNPSSEEAFVPTMGRGLAWSRLTTNNHVALPADSAELALYENAVRFGTNVEAGLNFRLMPQFEITLAYERDIIFRRHQVIKWIGSVVTEGTGQWLVDRVVHRIARSSPRAGPIVSFLLKNGLSFAVYQLRHKEMYFPFSSESPLANDTFKIGMTIIW